MPRLRLRLRHAVALVLAAACSDPPPADDGTPIDAALVPEVDAWVAPTGACATGSRLIYLNRGGGTYSPGAESSAANTSGIVRASTTLAAWNTDALTFDGLRACIAYNYARYDVRVVDADPGAAEHVEIVLAQSIAALGFPPQTTGVAPAPTACQPLRSAIVFYGAAAYGPTADGLEQLCTDASRSVADALGLDEIFDARSIMSWLESTAPRSFLDEERPCGELEARTCRCGGTTQNSHQRLAAVLGPCPG